jgi:hypothetical protein
MCGSDSRRNLTENGLVSRFEYTTSSLGSPRPAYVPVCASGENALTIHYIANNQPIKEGDLVMLDAGCEYGGYASDITRKSPNFPFTSTHRLTMRLVLDTVRYIPRIRQIHTPTKSPLLCRPPNPPTPPRSLSRPIKIPLSHSRTTTQSLGRLDEGRVEGFGVQLERGRVGEGIVPSFR